VCSGITRRAMLAGIPGCLFASGTSNNDPKSIARTSEFVPFIDPVTETPVVRLTDPRTKSLLPEPTSRFISVKDRFLLFSSDRTGVMCPFRLDLRSGAITQLAKTSKLSPKSLCLNKRGNAVYLLEDGLLREITLSNLRSRTIADGITSFCELSGQAETDTNFVVVRNGRLELLEGQKPVLSDHIDDFCLARPGGRGILFRKTIERGNIELWYAPLIGDRTPVMLTTGDLASIVWTRDGREILYLRETIQKGVLVSAIYGIDPETRTEHRVAPTSQFAAFSPNADTSVFVGASRSKAQPTILLLLASVQRELTLCEHRASNAADVSPLFSPDSRRVYFQSDHEGKSALYSVNVERLVEPTPESA
jgi:oligogalacturonide lyase